MKARSVSVPCGGCTLCCRRDAISLRPDLGDDVTQYQTEPHCIPELAGRGILMLAHKPDLSCVYLADDGCSIHGRAPALCREFDCRQLVKKLGYTNGRKAVKGGLLSAGIFRRGMELIPTLALDAGGE